MAGESKSRGRTGEAATASFGPHRARRLKVTRSVSIPRSEIELRFSRSSGPGGQHAQKTETRAEAIFDVERSLALSDVQKRRVLAKTGPVLRAVAQDERSQWRNRELAIERVVDALRDALKVERKRRPTRPTAAAKRRRLEQKRQRSETKRLRRPPTEG
jgi:ribosome-associated protein